MLSQESRIAVVRARPFTLAFMLLCVLCAHIMTHICIYVSVVQRAKPAEMEVYSFTNHIFDLSTVSLQMT